MSKSVLISIQPKWCGQALDWSDGERNTDNEM